MNAEQILFYAIVALILLAGGALLGVWRLAGAVDELRKDNHHLRTKLRLAEQQIPQRPAHYAYPPAGPLSQRIGHAPTVRLPRVGEAT